MLKVAQSRSSEFSDGWSFRICAPCHGRQLLGVSASPDKDVNRVCEGFEASAHVAGTALSKHIFKDRVQGDGSISTTPHNKLTKRSTGAGKIVTKMTTPKTCVVTMPAKTCYSNK